ncbi:MAG: hypothetical protein JWN78_2064 [Bacteroidota bacterium]|nr:hypothetical protein [Bacteroidota bacterium]
MKKLSLLIALGSFVFLSIAKPEINSTQFESYSQQMKTMSDKYISENKFDYASKTIDKWLLSYSQLPEKERANYKAVYSSIMYNQAIAYTQTNEMYKALKALKEAVRTGFNNGDQAQNDPNLAKLRSYDEFNKIIKSIKA